MKFTVILFAAAVLVWCSGCASTSARHSDLGGTGGCVTQQGASACESLEGRCKGSYNEWDKDGAKSCECCGEKQENPKYNY